MGDCDAVVTELCNRAEWSLVHEMIPADQQVDVQLAESHTSRWQFQVQQPVSTPEQSEPPRTEDDNEEFVHIDHITPQKDTKWSKDITPTVAEV